MSTDLHLDKGQHLGGNEESWNSKLYFQIAKPLFFGAPNKYNEQLHAHQMLR